MILIAMVVILVVVLVLVQAVQLARTMLAVQGEILPVNHAQVSNALVFIVPIVLAAIVVINVQIVKLAIRNVTQITNYYFILLNTSFEYYINTYK